MQAFLLFFLLSVGITTHVASEAPISTEVTEEKPSVLQQQYEQILVAYRATIGQKGTTSTNVRKKSKHKDISFGTLPLPEQTQMEMALELMSRLDQPAYQHAQPALFAADTWQSLRLISQEPSALSGIAPDMKTIFGKLFLARTLTTPTIDLERIKLRQMAITELCHNKLLLKKIAAKCTQVRGIQEKILGLTNSEHPLYQPGLRIYLHDFFLRPINAKSKHWNRIVKIFGDIWYAAGPFAISAALFSMWKNFRQQTKKGTVQTGWKNNLFSFQWYGKNPSDKNTRLQEGGSAAHKKSIEERYGLDYRLIGGLLALITAYNGAIQLPGIITWLRNRFRAANYFYDQLLPLKKFFSATQKLKETLEQLPKLSALKDEIDTALYFNDPTIMQLRSLLMGPAFTNRALGHLIGGDLVLALDLLSKCRDKILKGIGLIGALDTYSSLAKWYNKLRHSATNPLCLAKLTPGSSPLIKVTDFWHVLAKETPMLNNLTLGDSEPRNALINGIFESGKSTVLQSIALNVVCSQSIGICLARTYSATLFASINIYAKIKDDLANNRSLFKTELYRALQLLEQLKMMPAGHFGFTIADSTFTGTEAGAGQAAAYAVACHLGKLQNSIALHATNFISLNILSRQYPKLFSSYNLATDVNGKTVQSYALEKGAPDLKYATEIFKEEKLPESILQAMEAASAA